MTQISAPANIFLSYARENSPFTDDLVISLRSHGFNPLRDLEELAAGETWETRLTDLVKQGDTLIFVATPLSLSSTACTRELDIAFELGKRVIPLVTDGADFDAMPERLRKLQFIVFGRDGRSYAQSIADLVEALRTDITWVREHARLTADARRWASRNRSNGGLLHGQALEDALQWRGQKTPAHMEVSDVVDEWLGRSRQVERSMRTRAATGAAIIFVTLGIAVAAGYVAYSGNKAAEQARIELEANDLAAEELRATIAMLQARIAVLEGPGAERHSFSLAQLEPYIANLTSPNTALRRNSRRDIGGLLLEINNGELNRAFIARMRSAAAQDSEHAYQYWTGAAMAIRGFGQTRPEMSDRADALADLAAMCAEPGVDPLLRAHFSRAIAIVSGRPELPDSCDIPS